jgi:nitroreductase
MHISDTYYNQDMQIVEEITKIRTPQTTLPVLDIIKKRFSPRVFSSDPVSPKDLDIIFEAARLAPSGRNHQPWYFYTARQGTSAYDQLLTCLPVRNTWAKGAPVMIVACYDPTDPKGGTNRWAQFDLGAAVFSLVLQATELGYSCRQVGSFDWEKAKKDFSIPDPWQVFSLIVIGKMGTEVDYQKVDPEIIQKEIAPNPRKSRIWQDLSF